MKDKITTEILNKAMCNISKKALKENRKIGLSTLYTEDGYLIKESAGGSIKILKKI